MADELHVLGFYKKPIMVMWGVMPIPEGYKVIGVCKFNGQTGGLFDHNGTYYLGNVRGYQEIPAELVEDELEKWNDKKAPVKNYSGKL